MQEENVLGEGVSVWLFRPTLVAQHENYCPSITSWVVGKMLKISTFNGDPTKKGDVSFEQGGFEVKSDARRKCVGGR